MTTATRRQGPYRSSSDRAVRVLFVCRTGSCRSVIADVLARHLSGGRVDSRSAGTEPRAVDPLTVRALAEVGLEAPSVVGLHVDQLVAERFDFVVGLCDRPREPCPTGPRGRPDICWSIDDPASAVGPMDQRMKVLRRVRDDLRHRIDLFMLSHRMPTRVASSEGR